MSNNRFTQEQESEICRLYNTPNEIGDLPTAKEIGVIFGCSDSTIRNILRRHKMKVRRNQGRQVNRLLDRATEIAACEYYWTLLPSGYYPSYSETAVAFGCAPAHIRNLLKRHGYKRRTHAETRDRRPCKPINQPNGNAPLCACGCGQPVQWVSKNRHWRKYAPGHYRGKERKTVQSPEHLPWSGGARIGRWTRLSKQIKRRDQWKCQQCGKQYVPNSGYLHVHHIDEDKTNNHPHNLITLCAACHRPAHGKPEIREKLTAIATANTTQA